MLVLGVALLCAGSARAADDVDVAGPDKILGFSGISQTGPITPAESASLIAGIGGNTSRTALHWQALEPQRDVYKQHAQGCRGPANLSAPVRPGMGP
jgi:hypothetical protein